MAETIGGIVRNGVIIPDSSLPEGARVTIALAAGPARFTPEEQEEFDAWSAASARAVELVERLAQGGEGDETR